MSGAEVILGVVAGGAGLMSLSIQLAESAVKLNRLYHGMKDAPQALKDIADEVQIMSLSLRHLEQHRRNESHGADILDQCIEQCQRHVARIELLTDRVSLKLNKASLTGRLYAAFKERDFDKLLGDLDRARAALHLAVSLYRSGEEDRRWHLQKNDAAQQRDQIAMLHLALQARHDEMMRHFGMAVQYTGLHQVQHVEDSLGDTTNHNEAESSDRQVSVQDRAEARNDSMDRRPAFRVKLKLPAWFSSRVWEIARIDAMQGWDLCFRTYNVRSDLSPIIVCCEKGDLDGVQRLIGNGEASLLDIDSYGKSLVEVSMKRIFHSSDDLRLTRWLLEQRSPIAKHEMHRTLVHFLVNCHYCGHQFRETPANREAALQLFFEDHRLEMDHEYWSQYVRLCDSLDELASILSASRGFLRELSRSERGHLGASAFNPGDPVALYLAKHGLPIPELALFQCRSGGSTLHDVAEALSSTRNTDQREWGRLGVDIIRNGADLFSMKRTRWPWWGACTPVTPLLQLLRDCVPDGDAIRASIEAIRRNLKLWTGMLKKASVDLEWYYATECGIWQTTEATFQLWQQAFRQTITQLVKVEFRPGTQSFGVFVFNNATLPIMQLHHLPGSFPNCRSPLETICWKPNSEEMEEGHWFLTEKIVLRGGVMDINALVDESSDFHEPLIECTQDDNGTLMRMLRSTRDNDRSSRRASSQPPPQDRRRYNYETLCYSQVHRWLPVYHLCHASSTWVVSNHCFSYWSGGEFVDTRICAHRTATPRCKDVPYRTLISHYRDVSHRSYRPGFLGDIRDCQSGFPTTHLLMPSDDTGIRKCPLGCDKINLEFINRLTETHDLPDWHPCWKI